jgi:hypothetical protein
MDLSAIGRQFGLDEQQTKAAFDALAPVVAAGMRRTSQPGGGGLGDLIGSLAGGNPTRYADDTSAFEQPGSVDDGNAVLGQIFGSKDVSRGVAQQISANTGISDTILKKLLPIVAAFVMGQIAKKALGGGNAQASPGGGGLGDILGDLLGGGASRQQPQGGGLGDILGDLLGGGQQGRAAQQESQGGGLGDILGDILGGGQAQQQDSPQRRQPQAAPRGGLDDLLSDILGGGNRTSGSGSGSGSAADDLLNSVEQAIRRR